MGPDEVFYHSSRFVDDDKFFVLVMMYYPDGYCSNWRFMTVDNISARLHQGKWDAGYQNTLTLFDLRS